MCRVRVENVCVTSEWMWISNASKFRMSDRSVTCCISSRFIFAGRLYGYIWHYLTTVAAICCNSPCEALWSWTERPRPHFKLCVTILQPSHLPRIARYGCSQLSVWCNQLDPFSGTPQWQLYAHMCVHCCSLNWNVVMSAREPRARYKKKAYHGVLLIDSNASICFSMLLHPLYNLI